MIPKREENLIKNIKEKIKLCTNSYQIIQGMQVSHPIGKIILDSLQSHFLANRNGCKTFIILFKEIYREYLKLKEEEIHSKEIFFQFKEILNKIINKLELLKFEVKELMELSKFNLYFLFKKNDVPKYEIFNGFCIQIPTQNFQNGSIKDCKLLFLNEPLLIKELKNSHLEFNTAQERLQFVKGERKILEEKLKIIRESSVDLIVTSQDIDERYEYELEDKLIKVSKNIYDNLIFALKGKSVNLIRNPLPFTAISKVIISNSDQSTLFQFENESSRTIIIQGETKTEMNEIKE